MSFAERLKNARIAKGYSQAALADRLGVSSGTIGNYESGTRPKPDKKILHLIAECFDIPEPDLEDGPQLTGAQYDAFCARLTDALDHTSSDDFEAMGLSESAIRNALRQRAPIREDRAVELARTLGTRIDDILAMPPELISEREATMQRLYDEHRVLFKALDSATPEELAKVEEYIKFLKTQR